MNILDGMEAFLHVADFGSYTAAARRLNLSPSAVSKLITKTEEAFGARLLNRNTRGLSLTQEGEIFLLRCRVILSELESARLELSQSTEQPVGKLRISLPNMPSFFAPIISDFMDGFPGVILDVDLSDRVVDVVEEGFDVVIRAGELTDSRLTARRISGCAMNLVASPSYISRYGNPSTIDDLKNHKCILYRYPSSGRVESWLLNEDADQVPKAPSMISSNSTDLRLNLALKGKGLVLLPRFLTEHYVRSGELRMILQDKIFRTYDISIVWPTNKHSVRRLRAFVEHVASSFKSWSENNEE